MIKNHNAYFFISSVLLVIVLLLLVLKFTHLPTPSPLPTASTQPKKKDRGICIQVITPAKNPATGQCREFPTPCDIPADWVKTPKCN